MGGKRCDERLRRVRVSKDEATGASGGFAIEGASDQPMVTVKVFPFTVTVKVPSQAPFP